MMNNQNIYRQVCESIYGTEREVTSHDLSFCGAANTVFAALVRCSCEGKCICVGNNWKRNLSDILLFHYSRH